jgi:transcriptional regulator with XRE-family HTH domain
LSEKSAVALGYISEVERGHKEASSEILEALAEALGTEVAEVLMDAGARLKVWSLPNIVPTFNETKLLAHSN